MLPPQLPPGARPSFPGLVAGITLFIVLGVPLTAYLWETLNQLLAGGNVGTTRALLTLLALVLLIVVWRLLAYTLQRWDAGHRTGPIDRSPQ